MQKILKKNVFISQYLMGIGSGTDVSESGEDVIFAFLLGREQPPYCIFDVGANKGQFVSLVLESLPIPDLSIHCFEPGKITFQALTETVKNNIKVTFNNLGLGREKGKMVLYYCEPGSGTASLTKRRLDHLGVAFEQSEEVMVETIDNYCLEHSVSKINLLKIDVEGHELDVLAGANQMFAKNAIGMVMFEFGGANIDTRTFFQDFWYFFLNVSMKILRITPSGYLVPINAYEEIDEQFRTTNFLAVKD